MYAGLRRIGDPNDGTAVWTKLKGDKFEQALTERTEQWLAEQAKQGSSEPERSPAAKPVVDLDADASREAARKATAPKITDGAAAPTPAISQKLAAVNATLGNIESKLDKINDRPGPCCVVA